MATKDAPAQAQKGNTKLKIKTPALHDGRHGMPAIFEIGGTRFASNSPASIEEAAEINNCLQSIGGIL